MVVPPEASIPCPFSTRLATNADIPAIRAVVFSVRSEFDVRLIRKSSRAARYYRPLNTF